MTYFGLYALQHRGQESAGIAVDDEGTIIHHKGMGLIPDVFNKVLIKHLKREKLQIGHVRYSTTGASQLENAQPMVIKYKNGQLALGHNGNIVNAEEIREKMGELLVENGWANETAKQLASWDPYDQNASSPFFDPEWMFGIKDGFDVVIGNPPYVLCQPSNTKQEILNYYNSFKVAGYKIDLFHLFF